jgi:hypothetical protein
VSVYLDASVCGIEWLLDPESAELGELARACEERTPATPCDGRALAGDADLLRMLIRERHFGAATGRVAAPDDVLDAWERGVASARTWGEATTELQADLRAALGDKHVRLRGGRRAERAAEPAVEEHEVDGVLVLLVRRLMGGVEDERLLAAWVAAAERHFAHERIVVDLRSNPGGNDGHTYRWAERRLRAVDRFCKSDTWVVRGSPLGNWNAAAWREARDGRAAVPPALLAGRHAPRPDDVVDLEEESYDLPAGDRAWSGRMLVVTDRASRSSGESSAWLLRQGLGARIAGEPSSGMIEFGNIVPYALPSGLVVELPTKSNDFGFPVESVGFPVDVELAVATPVDEIARGFDAFV